MLYGILFRFIIFMFVVLGVYMLLFPIVTILGFIPLLEGFIPGTSIGGVIIAALIFSIHLYFVTLAIAWTFFFPKIGRILLVLGLVILTIVIILGNK